MSTEMEKLRAAKIKKEQSAKATEAAAKAALTSPTPGAQIPPAGDQQVQQEMLNVTLVGVLKVRNPDGTENGVSQTITLQVPKGFPKANYGKLMPQVWAVVLRQVGGLQVDNPDGSFTFYKDDLFERYGATFHEVVGVTI